MIKINSLLIKSFINHHCLITSNDTLFTGIYKQTYLLYTKKMIKIRFKNDKFITHLLLLLVLQYIIKLTIKIMHICTLYNGQSLVLDTYSVVLNHSPKISRT